VQTHLDSATAEKNEADKAIAEMKDEIAGTKAQASRSSSAIIYQLRSSNSNDF
jgi:F0F1-type ATP synthase membrane subunit b/b'